MFQFDSRLTTVFSILFVALGIFNLVLGRNRMLQMRASGQTLLWYRQIPILTGIEYILLGIVLLLNLSISSGLFPRALAGLAAPLYTLVLILAAIVLTAMLLQALRANRERRQPATQTPTTTIDTRTQEQENKDLSAEQKAETIQRRRDRRQKAAAARRRQSGRA